MTQHDDATSGGDTQPVLNGWKEIAAHFRKGVRTVQRWEAEIDMPVHRLAGAKGEVVYAVPSELDEWRRRHERAGEEIAKLELCATPSSPSATPSSQSATPSSPSPKASPRVWGESQDPPAPHPARDGRRRLSRGAVAAAALVLGAAALALVAWAWAHANPTRDPAKIRIVRDDLIATDEDGGTIWTAKLPYAPPLPENYQESDPTFMARHRVLVEDVDGDGRREVVMAMADERNDRGVVICFDARGRERWRRRPDRAAEFGHGRMAAPWIPLFLAVTRASDSAVSLWVSWAHRPYFGAFIERLDIATGEPAAVYWSAGYVTHISRGTFDGRQVAFLGAANNERQAASLAVYDLDATEGAAPASDPRYACSDCPRTRPRAFFVFPKTSVGRQLLPANSTIFVNDVMQDAAGQISVVVAQSALGAVPMASVLYRFDRSLRLTGAETLTDYQSARGTLERQGRLRPGSPSDDERELFPVLSWEGGKFVEIAGPQK